MVGLQKHEKVRTTNIKFLDSQHALVEEIWKSTSMVDL